MAEAYAVKYGYNFAPLEEEYTSCTVHFDANGGSGEMADQVIDFDVSAALTRNAFTRSGYTFSGWNSMPDGSGTACANAASVRNLATGGVVTLYAQGKPQNP